LRCQAAGHVRQHGNRRAVPGRLPPARPRQILSCLTDDIEWTVSGASRITGKPAYDVAIELPGEATRHTGDVLRMSMAEVFVMRDGLIAERRAG
jgi:hypothetical protein